MITVHYYDGVTGIFSGNHLTTTDEAAIDLNKPSHGHVAVVGHYDHLSQRVDVTSGEIVDYQPPQPSLYHEWDDASKRWKLNAEVAAREECKTAARARIAYLESNVLPRALREFALNQPNALERLRGIDEEIALLRCDIIG